MMILIEIADKDQLVDFLSSVFETKKLTAIINKLKEVHTSDNENK